MKQLPILYKYTTKGQAQQWEVIIEDNRFYTREGMVGGKLTLSLPTICQGKNIGRSNETTPEQQAWLEGKAKWQKKVDKGYNEVISEEKKFFEPMLAKDAKEVEIDFTKTRVFVQPKLDGLRCINADNALASRNGKPYIACPHLHQDEVTLDGELYSHLYKDDFNKIVSLCKKQKPTEEEIAEAKEKVQMWVYDFPDHNGPFSERREELYKWALTQGVFLATYIDEDAKFITSGRMPVPNKPMIFGKDHQYILVPTFEVKSQDDIDYYHSHFLDQGYEGTIIRLDLGPYENKRSKQLLKYKDFVDAEFTIIGYEEGVGGRTGTIGFFHMEDSNKKTFKSNVKGDFDYLKQVWKDRDSYIGKTATVKYFNLTPLKEDGTGGVPRFPYIIKINREEYE